MASAVNLLQLSPTMTEGTLVKWLVKEGDAVTSGQAIAEIETDKAVMEQESFEDGTVLKILVNAGARMPVGSLMMVTGEKGEDIASILASASAPAAPEPEPAKKEAAAAAKPAPAPAAAPAAKPVAPPPAASPAAKAANRASGGRVAASPLARKMAQDAGIELSDLAGSGPSGRIVKSDIEAALAAPRAAASSPSWVVSGEVEELPVSGMRQTIARRLIESKTTVPHFQLTVEVRGERLLEAVAQIKELDADAKVTVTHFLIKAMASAAMRHRAIRSQWAGNTMRVLPSAHITVAVAIEDGLVTPVIRDAHTKGVMQLSSELRDLAKRARDRKLTMEDMSGGVQTLSNLGMFGIHQFAAIINPPESSILAVGAMEDRPVVEKGAVVPGKVFTLTMSCDHRVIDGAVGAQYLGDLKRSLENPALMML